MLSDSEILALKAKMDEGDRSAALALFDEVFPYICKVACQFIGKSSMDLDELRNEASLIAWQHLTEWNPEKAGLRIYLGNLVRFRLSDKIDSEKRHNPEVVSESVEEYQVASKETDSERRRQYQAARKHLRRLIRILYPDPLHEKILFMHWGYGSYRVHNTDEEIASEIGWFIEAVTDFLHKAHKNIACYQTRQKDGDRLHRCRKCRTIFATKQKGGVCYCSDDCKTQMQKRRKRCSYCNRLFRAHSNASLFCSDRCKKRKLAKPFYRRKCLLPDCQNLIRIDDPQSAKLFCSDQCNLADKMRTAVPVGQERKCYHPDCENRFVVHHKNPFKRYCGNRCVILHRKIIAPVELPCTVNICQRKRCSKTFAPPVNNKGQQYCSMKCLQQNRIDCRKQYKCDTCDKMFIPKDIRKDRTPRFCSRKCLFESGRTAKKRQYVCETCGGLFSPKQNRSGHVFRFCSSNCRDNRGSRRNDIKREAS